MNIGCKTHYPWEILFNNVMLINVLWELLKNDILFTTSCDYYLLKPQLSFIILSLVNLMKNMVSMFTFH